ncbi:MAG: hypothetical protein ACK526_01105 [Planctomyces sp.]
MSTSESTPKFRINRLEDGIVPTFLCGIFSWFKPCHSHHSYDHNPCDNGSNKGYSNKGCSDKNGSDKKGGSSKRSFGRKLFAEKKFGRCRSPVSVITDSLTSVTDD